MPEQDTDAELQAWQEVQAMDWHAIRREEEARHRCPSDVPPCPDCQR
jgi:hypothetical protein